VAWSAGILRRKIVVFHSRAVRDRLMATRTIRTQSQVDAMRKWRGWCCPARAQENCESCGVSQLPL
jgi:hypothetical protein